MKFSNEVMFHCTLCDIRRDEHANTSILLLYYSYLQTKFVIPNNVIENCICGRIALILLPYTLDEQIQMLCLMHFRTLEYFMRST